MKYSNVYIDTIAYELPSNVVTSSDIENKLKPYYDKFKIPNGQIENLTGIRERRYWDKIHTMYEGAARAGKKAIEESGISVGDIGMLTFCGVCRDGHEPATACAVSDALHLEETAQVYDISNACLGVLTGMIQTANAIELGQIQAGLVVSCESARQIIDATIESVLKSSSIDFFKTAFPTFTGGSGAVAVLMTSKSVKGFKKVRSQLLGGVLKNANKFHNLCFWGPEGGGMPVNPQITMRTDGAGVLKNGVILAKKTYNEFKNKFLNGMDFPDKIVCHQVGLTHQKFMLETLKIPAEKDFTTFEYLGNIGSVSLPITAAIASEREFITKGDLVGFMGIGSGLNCMILAIKY